tara:strand:+ start:368 stop:553 length:186 start_codon:yes stop_codon:yes gene_type:complete
MRTIRLENTAGEEVMINWSNVCSVTTPENYFCGDVYHQINFNNKEHIYVKNTMDEIEERLD